MFNPFLMLPGMLYGCGPHQGNHLAPGKEDGPHNQDMATKLLFGRLQTVQCKQGEEVRPEDPLHKEACQLPGHQLGWLWGTTCSPLGQWGHGSEERRPAGRVPQVPSVGPRSSLHSGMPGFHQKVSNSVNAAGVGCAGPTVSCKVQITFP